MNITGPFKLVDISVDYFAEGGFWTISACSYVNPDDQNEQPEPFQDSQEADDEESALQSAEHWAELIIAQKWARRVVVFNDGNEHKVYDMEDKVENHS